jgi:hypothetical protein
LYGYGVGGGVRAVVCGVYVGEGVVVETVVEVYRLATVYETKPVSEVTWTVGDVTAMDAADDACDSEMGRHRMVVRTRIVLCNRNRE